MAPAITVSLSAPELADVDELLAFELDNRAFFESMINARPADYYSAEGVRAGIAAAQDDAQTDRSYQFLLRDESGVLVGRVNLSQVRRQHFHAAMLGYRIGQAHQGRGFAKAAVAQVLAHAFQTLGLARVEATARSDNPGSLGVLRSNGFDQFGHSRRSFELNGVWHDLLHFERHAKAF
ncbi:GNAT family N-acetyltransferase [Roseateles koreensis]|uniref:GNAT family protein n=1 Tax=Roseateles koreensis TaxID=2987526 RepID=A0ABT5KMQ2_9BURK|nr:GNAT family protein [Roseateles koreensis]MDC8784198.1 GNAT family protein [Roseateles koreensis]